VNAPAVVVPRRTSRADQNRAALQLGRRARTLSIQKLLRPPASAPSVLDPDEDVIDLGPAPARPRTRGDCEAGPRPCPWVACKYHLYLDVDPVHGSIKFNWPDHEPWELRETCALDVARAPEGQHLVTVGELVNLTRERIRQIERRALRRVRAAAGTALAAASDLLDDGTEIEDDDLDEDDEP
jgi:hypothetical protein